MSDETWRKVGGWPYEVSDLGNARRLDTKNRLKGSVTHNGYRTVTLSRDGDSKSFRVHRLVLSAFVGPPPEGCEADHINGVRDDNRLENLRWLPRGENRSRPGDDCPHAKLTEDKVAQIRRLYDASEHSQRELAELFGVHQWTIWSIVNGKTWETAEGPTQAGRAHTRGENNGRSKLNEPEVVEIRRRYQKEGDATLQSLANEYGVNNSSIWRIVHGTRWEDAPGPTIGGSK